MDHSIRVWIGSGLDRVMFELKDILGRFGLGRFRVNQFLIKYARHVETSNFVKNFGSDIVRFGSVRVSDPLSGEHISGVGSGMRPARSDFGSRVKLVRSNYLCLCTASPNQKLRSN